MADTEFNGETYRDDRMFVLYVCPCTVDDLDQNTIETVIYHEAPPAEHLWCVVTYRNTSRFPATRVDHFRTHDEAHAYLQKVEPSVPLVSLGGSSPRVPLPYAEFAEWKSRNQFKEFDFRDAYSTGIRDAVELVVSRKRG